MQVVTIIKNILYLMVIQKDVISINYLLSVNAINPFALSDGQYLFMFPGI